MRLIHHEHIPARRHRLRRAPRVSRQEANAGQHELVIQKRVGARFAGFDGRAAFLIENMQPHVEAAEHFHEPLVDERFRHQYQDAIRPSAQQQAMQDQTGLDGFSKPHFVREHHARGVPVGDLLGDVKLVRNQINAAADESAHRGFARAVEQIQRAATQLKRRRGIKAARQQTLLRPPQTEAVAQLGFGELLVFANINQQALPLDRLPGR